MHRLMKALATQSVIVKNVTSGEVSVHYPEIGANDYPTGVVKRLNVSPGQTLNLTDTMSVKALKLSSNLKKLVKARHLLVVL